jgi:hypothetical protein
MSSRSAKIDTISYPPISSTTDDHHYRREHLVQQAPAVQLALEPRLVEVALPHPPEDAPNAQ